MTTDKKVVSDDLDKWASHSYHCGSWPTAIDTKQYQEDWVSFEGDLLANTKHHASADLVKKMFVPVSIKLVGGQKTFGFVLETGAHLLQETGSVALVTPLIRQSEMTIEDVDLKVALSPHKYGKLVRIEDYNLAADDDDFWHLPFKGTSGLISRQLQSCLIQSGNDVTLCLKVEVYGRSQGEDPQADANVALPVGRRSFNIVNQQFKDVSQLMIGCVRWNVLVTLAVSLTSGKVIVGPHNPSFKPHRKSHLWLKRGAERDMHNNLVRRTRSNFDNMATYRLHAAIHPHFNRSHTRPVTLSDLWSFKAKNAWSGVKLAAFIFNNLYDASEPLLKSEVQDYLSMIQLDKGDNVVDEECDHGIRSNLIRFAKCMRDQETRPVSLTLDKELRCMADHVRSEITKINQTIVSAHVRYTIDMMLQD
ncbi:hypothetical protein BG011_001396 [Mortierella polycephala]|uniref:Uncharacterized protein n=1 Tax=Mortierella polycephala TaxID=41804 RepID=A0A9P6PLE3_9FUNG|nr:hypothetical protein BG011_001396 [Mortierella polycephala]